MQRLTHDAVAVQSVLGAGESLTIGELARQAFCREAERASATAMLRARRACSVLRERGLIHATETGLIMAANGEAQSALLLGAALTRTIMHCGPSIAEEELAEGEK